MDKSKKTNILEPLKKENKQENLSFRVSYSDGTVFPIIARCIVVANAVARLYANGRSYGIKQV